MGRTSNNKKSKVETKGFETEVNQLLHLMINALYSNKEIFLRELISNASDACDKLRYESLTHSDWLPEGADELQVNISFDRDTRTIVVQDNGIGMTYEEVVKNLGTIAKSGTKEFLAQLSNDAKQDAELIGQFGVGFYSSFIVGEQVDVYTRHPAVGSESGVHWQSKGEGEYTIERSDRVERGTEIHITLKADEDEFLSGSKLRQLIRTYSDHISRPIRMQKEEWDKDASAYVQLDEWEVVNKASALWARPKSEISDEEYQEFYRNLTFDFEPPLKWSHNRVEGTHEYTQLLFIPSRAPFDLYDRSVSHGVKLYVQRVFIMDDAEKLLPLYLRFVRGVIDSNDLPLNISRELLQQTKDIDSLRAGNTRRILSMLEELAEKEPEAYQNFWNTFGNVLKEGLGEDASNGARLSPLLRFASSHHDHDDQIVSLEAYVSRMKPEQKYIYYVTAETAKAARNSPHLELFKQKQVEVLLMSDRVDEWVVSHMPQFKELSLQSVSKGELDDPTLNAEDEVEASSEDKAEKNKAQEESLKPLIESFTQALEARVKGVRISHRLTESPACLVSDENDASGNLARILKSAGQDVSSFKPYLEINPNHPLITRAHKADAHAQKEWATVLFDQALLAEGGHLEDPGGYVRQINRLLMEQSA